MLDRVGGGFKEYAPFALRLGLATIFIIYGARMLPRIGQSPSLGEILTLAVTLLGGLFALIGFFTRWAAFGILTLVFVKILSGPEFDAVTQWHDQLWLAALVMSFALFGLGGGKWSVDVSNKKKKDEG